MRTLLVSLAAVLALAGCSSLHSQVFSQIHEGDSSDKVVAAFGQPDNFSPSTTVAGGTDWFYIKRHDICGFTVAGGAVKQIACGENANYVNPVGAILKGMGDGLRQSASSPSTNCTSHVIGNTIYTNCN